MDARAPQRVGDDERHVAMDRLAEGFGTGRLRLQEYEERVALVLAARTPAELSELVLDLPAGPSQERAAAEARRREDLRTWLREWQYWVAGAVLLVGVWGVRSAAGGDLEPFWPGVPLGIWAVVLVAAVCWPHDD